MTKRRGGFKNPPEIIAIGPAWILIGFWAHLKERPYDSGSLRPAGGLLLQFVELVYGFNGRHGVDIQRPDLLFDL